MALQLGRIEQFLSAEDVWGGFTKGRASYGKLMTYAPNWANVALSKGMNLAPRLDGRLATVGLTDYHLLALWAVFKGRSLRTGQEGQQLVAEVESGWADFKAWLWRTFGL